ncbi:MAG: hypothetical protein LBG26_07070 [Treponema sp.]|jgi:hypothetical protein|nr:hypothetical protein [Treponema sp.]
MNTLPEINNIAEEIGMVSFLNRPDFKIRLISLMSAFALALAGLLMALSTMACLLNRNFINTGPGEFLVNAYGILAFMVPAYLFWAAWILRDPVFRPGRIFVLSAALVPFLTLAIGLFLSRDFGRGLTLFGNLDLTGFGFAVIVLTTLECLAILIVHTLLFREKTAPAGSVSFRLPGRPKQADTPDRKPSNSAEQPNPEDPDRPGRIRPDPAGKDPSPVSESPEPGRIPLGERIRFPELKPLASSLALRDLDQFGFFNVEENAGISPEKQTGSSRPEPDREMSETPVWTGTADAAPETEEENAAPEAETAEIEALEIEAMEMEAM